MAGDLPPLVLHVGAPKTGTTALQHNVLRVHPQIQYFALNRKGGQYEVGSVFHKFVTWVRESADLDSERERFREWLNAELERCAAGARCRLLSEERFTGHMGAGLAAKAALARDLFPDARVIMTIREPVRLLVSNYVQHLRYPRIGQRPLPGFVAWVERTLGAPEDPLSYAQVLRFDDMVRYWEEQFGADRVLVLVYEEMLRDPERFYGRLAEWLGVDPAMTATIARDNDRVRNPAPTRPELWMWRARQRFVNRGPGVVGSLLTAASRVAGLVPVRPAVRPTPEVAAAIRAFAAPQCKALEERRALGLARYGYPVTRC